MPSGLLAAVSNESLFIINTEEKTSVIGKIENNKAQLEIIQKIGSVIGRRTFDASFPTNTSQQCLNKMMYLLDVDKE